MMYINGQWVNAVSGATFSTFNPPNGEKIGEVADALDKGATLVCGGKRLMDNNLETIEVQRKKEK